MAAGRVQVAEAKIAMVKMNPRIFTVVFLFLKIAEIGAGDK